MISRVMLTAASRDSIQRTFLPVKRARKDFKNCEVIGWHRESQPREDISEKFADVPDFRSS